MKKIRRVNLGQMYGTAGRTDIGMQGTSKFYREEIWKSSAVQTPFAFRSLSGDQDAFAYNCRIVV